MSKSNKELAVEMVAAYYAGHYANSNLSQVAQEFTEGDLREKLWIAYNSVSSLPDNDTEK